MGDGCSLSKPFVEGGFGEVLLALAKADPVPLVVVDLRGLVSVGWNSLELVGIAIKDVCVSFCGLFLMRGLKLLKEEPKKLYCDDKAA